MIFLIFSTQGSHPCFSHHGAEIHNSDGRNSSQLSGSRMDRCELKASVAHLFCSGGLHGEWKSGSERVRVLTLCRWPEEAFDAEALMLKFPSLQKLSVMDSNITSFSTYFPEEAAQLEHVNFTGTKLGQLDNDTFSSLPALQTLDLRGNEFSDVSVNALNLSSLQHIYLSENPWTCDSGKSWLLDMSNDSVASRVVDRDKLICLIWSSTRPAVAIIEIMVALEKECLRTVCECELSHTQSVAQGMRPFVWVNCSNRGLTEMPSFLPSNTTRLHISNNQISDLSPLLNNPVYQEVGDIYMDKNRVESIELLEGSSWFDNFRVLSLRDNYLTDFPTYALENVLQRDNNVIGLYLGNNPWRCDCHVTPAFRRLLISQSTLVKDVDDVRCSSANRIEISNKQIQGLSRTEICIPPEKSWLQPLDVLNVVLASLILLVIGNLLYDYWTFKKTGKLPWIVTKIP